MSSQKATELLRLAKLATAHYRGVSLTAIEEVFTIDRRTARRMPSPQEVMFPSARHEAGCLQPFLDPRQLRFRRHLSLQLRGCRSPVDLHCELTCNWQHCDNAQVARNPLARRIMLAASGQKMPLEQILCVACLSAQRPRHRSMPFRPGGNHSI